MPSLPHTTTKQPPSFGANEKFVAHNFEILSLIYAIKH
jgi:hypothetical protein